MPAGRRTLDSGEESGVISEDSSTFKLEQFFQLESEPIQVPVNADAAAKCLPTAQ
jgi:hypothetical protein